MKLSWVPLGSMVAPGTTSTPCRRPTCANTRASTSGRAIHRADPPSGTRLLNPKVVLFFLAFLPQFVTDPANARGEMLLLGAVFFAIALAMDLVYAVAGGAVSNAMRRRPSSVSRQHLVVGGIYLSLGAYAAFA